MKTKKKNNKKLYIFFGVVLLLFIVLITIDNSNILYNKLSASINPSINSIGIECQKNTVSVGETISCTLKGNAVEQIQLFEGKFVNNQNIEISNIQKNSIWVIGTNSSKMQFISDGTRGTFDIVTFNVKGIKDGDGVVSVEKIKDTRPLAFTTKNLNVINLASASYKFKVGSGNGSSDDSYGEVNTDLENNEVNKTNMENNQINKQKGDIWVPQTGQTVIRYYEIIIGIVLIILGLMIIKNKIKDNSIGD